MEAFQRWMVEEALPLWASNGRDPSGFFYERLKLDGAPDREAVRRTRVQFRQIYVYSAAYLLGFCPEGADIAHAAFRKVREQAWAPDGTPGWAHLIGPDGTVVDPKRDAYDQAFALLALAWLYRTRHDPSIREAIDETLSFVDARIAVRSGGWCEAVAPEGGVEAASELRRQNPHMHALEAMMALYEATGERGFLDRAREIYHLFAARFFDRSADVVIEYFDADWRPAPPRRQRIEPGHMAEWVFLIREYERLTGDAVDGFANPLFAKTMEIGLDPSGRFLVDELYLDGELSKRTRRLWPQTEFLKAALCQYRVSGDDHFRDLAQRILSDLRAEYLSGVIPGGWRDCFDVDGGAVADHIPASTLYHLFPAFNLCRDLLSRRMRRSNHQQPLRVRTASKGAYVTPVVLAGGAGARLWPLSTAARPKQFLPLTSARSMLQETLRRVGDDSLFKKPMIVCSGAYEDVVAEQAAEISAPLAAAIFEPAPRSSAPAIAAAALVAAKGDPDALLLITPADHMIRETALFTRLIDNAADAARQGSIVTFGVTPTRPEVAYGYIRAGAPIGMAGAFEVAAFVEKPDLTKARSYLATGSYLWNSGMFLFRAGDFLEELQRWRPEMLAAVRDAVDQASYEQNVGKFGGGDCWRLDAESFEGAPSDSIDYAVMEKTERAVVCQAALTWSDIGSWDAIALAEEGDKHGNATLGPATLLSCEGVYVRSEGPHVAAIGLSDMVVVATPETVLITTKDQAQSVKELAEKAGADRAAES
ncbi:MAG: mannose-1-phosphate guanylyltransferase/mannose-6-phosphate isomerase [Neomegalonema sp.]|nr:mannose-1-phosphate guanylyltransferase/mannose-6-phosphate isomerase [Neomegalonema sp.]